MAILMFAPAAAPYIALVFCWTLNSWMASTEGWIAEALKKVELLYIPSSE